MVCWTDVVRAAASRSRSCLQASVVSVLGWKALVDLACLLVKSSLSPENCTRRILATSQLWLVTFVKFMLLGCSQGKYVEFIYMYMCIYLYKCLIAVRKDFG